MTKTELKNKSDKELMKDLQDSRKGLREFRFGMSGSKTRDSKAGQKSRKTIARILTEVNSR